MIREKALAFLGQASDQDLLRLSATLRHWYNTEQIETKWLEQAATASHTSFTKTHTPEPQPKELREEIEPPGEACQRIGSETQESILNNCPASLEGLCAHLKRKPDDMRALTKLLWKRGLLKYDGENYYA
jgi:hypothetical protein